MFAQINCHFGIFLLLLGFISKSEAVKCLDCIGKNCMGSFCEGDYCVLSHYAPRWGTVEWGDPKVVKGCMSGTMLRKDVRSHCEVADANGEVINQFSVFHVFKFLRMYSLVSVIIKTIVMETKP